MKKTVSINIGGIIFHIEEDGYERLKNYLESVNKYFSTFEDSAEIIADIESRIAEIFLSKLADGRQTVNLEDVDELITTMGTTKDFEATIETEEPPTQKEEEKHEQAEAGEEKTTSKSSEGYRKLYRDTKRKVLGGVAAGIAHYFKIDPLWIRLIIIVLFINVFLGGISGATLLAYIILWIVLPPSDSLEDDKKVKKLFRNPDERVLGGVASGIASYFGTDIAVIRLLFVLSIFLGGAGIVIYIILWIITPEAKSITEKMQMQGEPVTLSNIEENVKKSLNVREGEESPIVKVLLFPFRLIAIIINGLGKLLGPLLKFLVEFIRIAFGALLIIIGFGLMIGFTSVTFGMLGIGAWEEYVHYGDFPLELIQQSLSTWPVVSFFLVTFIPALALTLVGLVVILKRRVAKAYVGWTLFALWITGLIIASFSIPQLAREFVTENDYRTEQTFEVTQATPTLRLNDIGNDSFDMVDLRIRGHQDSTFQLVQRIISRGNSRSDAEENARSIVYNVKREGEDFYFDSEVTFPQGTKFRFQEADLTFYIPYGKTFRMEDDLADILTNTLHLNGYRAYQMEGNDWAFDQNGIKCLTCPEKRIDRDRGSSTKDYRSNYRGSDEITYPFEDFDEVRISAFFDVEIRKGETYSIELKGDDEYLDEVYLNQVGELLEVKYREDNWKWWNDNNPGKVGLFITMPELEYLEMVGDCDGEVFGFDNDDMEIELTGESDLYMNVFPERLKLKMTGASSVDLKGEAESLDVELIGASEIKAFDFRAKRVDLEAVGASKGEVYGTDEIRITAAGVSKVKYRGTSKVSISEAGLSKVDRD